jgi:hypothetical protein
MAVSGDPRAAAFIQMMLLHPEADPDDYDAPQLRDPHSVDVNTPIWALEEQDQAMTEQDTRAEAIAQYMYQMGRNSRMPVYSYPKPLVTPYSEGEELSGPAMSPNELGRLRGKQELIDELMSKYQPFTGEEGD